MKAGYYLGGLALGLIIGGGIGYMIACDPEKRAKVDDFLTGVGDKVADMGDKVTDISDRIKEAMGLDYGDDLTEEDIIEIEAVLAEADAAKNAKATKTKKK